MSSWSAPASSAPPARRLAREGYRVSVVDDRRAGATAAGMGHLVCMDDNPAELALSAYSLRLWREVTGRMPQACAWRGCGTLWLADKADEMAIAEQKRVRLAEQGVAAELLTAEQIAAMEPMLRHGLAGGLRVPGDGILYAPLAARWLLADGGAAIDVVHGEAAALEEGAVRLADGRRLAAPVVLLACGLGANGLLPQTLLYAKRAIWRSPIATRCGCGINWWSWGMGPARMPATARRWHSMCRHGPPGNG